MTEPRKLRITLAQLNATVGDIDGNLSKMIETWKQYDSETDLVVFPELFLCGYPPEDLAHNAMFLRDLDRAVQKIQELSRTLRSAIVVPTITRPNGYEKKNALKIFQSGEEIHYQEKVKLPNYGVFDEPRIFTTADQYPKTVELNGIKIGFLICEDLWDDDVFMHLKNEGAEFFISINGSPYQIGKYHERMKIAENCVKKSGLTIAYLNLIGGQDDLVFDGHSFIVDKKGVVQFEAPSFSECVIQIKTQTDKIDVLSPMSALKKEELSDVYSALFLGLKDYVHKNGFQKALLGLSGGIDSALVACIAVDALGAQNVRCMMLPSGFTSKESLEDAEQCAKYLGVKYEVIPIQDAVKNFENIIPDLEGLAHENTQSRIRGLILMALSNISGELLLSTGNKSELATGYATLYGDMNGGFNPLKDVYKSLVYKLCSWRNAWEETIPERILTKAPSAELRENQIDQDSLPPYDILDNILNLLIEGDVSDEASVHLQQLKGTCTPEDVEKVAKLLRASEFKRRQSCPGPKISPRAFGKDRRYPITNKFVNRIEKA